MTTISKLIHAYLGKRYFVHNDRTWRYGGITSEPVKVHCDELSTELVAVFGKNTYYMNSEISYWLDTIPFFGGIVAYWEDKAPPKPVVFGGFDYNFDYNVAEFIDRWRVEAMEMLRIPVEDFGPQAGERFYAGRMIDEYRTRMEVERNRIFEENLVRMRRYYDTMYPRYILRDNALVAI